MMLRNNVLTRYLNNAEKALLETNARFPYNRLDFSMFPSFPGVYAIYLDNILVYIGETADINLRMKDLKNTYNHTFRRKLGNRFYPNAQIIGNKFPDEIELSLNLIFQNRITISFIEVNFGRSEIENYLISLHTNLFNSISRRGN